MRDKLTNPNSVLLTYCFFRFCFLQFKTKMEAERHRKSLAHRTRVKQSRGVSTQVTCQFCPLQMENLSLLKDHIWSQVS